MLFLLQLGRGGFCYSDKCLVSSNQFFSSYFTAATGIRFLQLLVLYAEPFMETMNREFSKSFFIKPVSHIFYTFDYTCNTFWPSISNWCHGRNFLYFIDQIIFFLLGDKFIMLFEISCVVTLFQNICLTVSITLK